MSAGISDEQKKSLHDMISPSIRFTCIIYDRKEYQGRVRCIEFGDVRWQDYLCGSQKNFENITQIRSRYLILKSQILLLRKNDYPILNQFFPNSPFNFSNRSLNRFAPDFIKPGIEHGICNKIFMNSHILSH